MRETIERRTCDVCGATAEHNPDTFGGRTFPEWQSIMVCKAPFSGWYYDACSAACAVKLLQDGPTDRPTLKPGVTPC